MYDIKKIDKKYRSLLDKLADDIESHFKEIREIKFTIEKGKLWIIEQSSVMVKSTQAEIKCLLDLSAKNIISHKDLINSIKPFQLSEILHPIIDLTSVKSLKSIIKLSFIVPL